MVVKRMNMDELIAAKILEEGEDEFAVREKRTF